MCAHRILESVCASTQSVQSSSFPPKETLDTRLTIERPSKTLIRLRGCAVWSEFSMCAHAKLVPFTGNRFISASSLEKGTYHTCNQQRIWWGCAIAQSHQTRCWLDRQSTRVDEGSYLNVCIRPQRRATISDLEDDLIEGRISFSNETAMLKNLQRVIVLQIVNKMFGKRSMEHSLIA